MKIDRKSLLIGFVFGIVFTFSGLYIAFKIDNRRTEIVEVKDIYIDLTKVKLEDIDVFVRHYMLPGQKPREWTREIYYEDMDSVTISKWDSLSSKERVEAIRRSFLFDPDVDWDSYTDEEQERMLLENAFVEWSIK